MSTNEAWQPSLSNQANTFTNEIVHEMGNLDILYIILTSLILLLQFFIFQVGYGRLFHMLLREPEDEWILIRISTSVMTLIMFIYGMLISAVLEKLPDEWWYFNAFWWLSKPVVLVLALEALFGVIFAVGVGINRMGEEGERQMQLKKEEEVRRLRERGIEVDEGESRVMVIIRKTLGMDEEDRVFRTL